jgi:tetratricopeptide (TPR) repeat protein
MRNIFYSLIFITLFIAKLNSQNKAVPVKQQLKQAAFYFDSGDYASALKAYKKVLEEDKKNETAHLFAFICRMNLNQPGDSLRLEADHLVNSKQPDALFYLGKYKHKVKSFDEATNYFIKYKSIDAKKRSVSNEEVENMLVTCHNAKKEISKPHRSVIRSLGPEINSIYAEYIPIISPDESALYFTSRRGANIYAGQDEDVYVSYKKGTAWGAAEKLAAPINSEIHDACVAISKDGKKMMLYRSAPGQITGDLYLSTLSENKEWESPKKMELGVNSQYIETGASFSSDTSDIYFSSNRPGGYGGNDLYRVRRLPNGRWGLPYNLGPTVNTKHDEDDPFMTGENVLYFSSRGHSTIGGFDVFKTNLTGDLNDFSDPENLGYPINTVNDDRFFVLSSDSKRAYYSSSNESNLGLSDIYEIDTRFKDDDLVVKHAIIYKNDVPGKAKVTLLDNENKQVAGIFNSNSGTGKFIFVMNPYKSYKAVVEYEGYTTSVLELAPAVREENEKELVIRLNKK